MRKATLGGALALTLALALPAAAGEGVAVGAAAPEVEAAGYINIEALKLSELKGRLIFLELFKTT